MQIMNKSQKNLAKMDYEMDNLREAKREIKNGLDPDFVFEFFF